MGDFGAALTHGLIACGLGGHSYVTHLSLACTYALTGDQAELAEALGHARALEPRLDVSFVTALGTRHLPAQMLERMVSELRNAGLPD